jgi:uncharacterized membrane protein YbhN (UPF0104 family)
MKFKNLKIIFPIIITLITLWVLQKNVKYEDILTLIKIISLKWLAVCFTVYFIAEVLRTYSIYFLMDFPEKKFMTFFSITNVYMFLNYMLPSKMGEVSYVILTKKYINISYSKSIPPFIIARITNISVFLLIALSMMIMHRWEIVPASVNVFFWVFFGIIIGIAIMIVMIVIFKSNFLKYICYKLSLYKLWNLIEKNLIEIRKSILYVNSFDKYIRLIILNFMFFLCFFSFYYFAVRAMGSELSYSNVILMLFISFISVLFRGLGNLGTHELGWIAVLKLLKFPIGKAVILAVGSHLLYILFLFMFFMISYLYLHFFKKDSVA